jgi:hypothetical protein
VLVALGQFVDTGNTFRTMFKRFPPRPVWRVARPSERVRGATIRPQLRGSTIGPDDAMETLFAQSRAAQETRNGRELAIFEHDFHPPCRLHRCAVGRQLPGRGVSGRRISESGVRAWIKAAEDGDPRYRAIADVTLTAEAMAESESVNQVRGAGRGPRFWAAAMTWLERKFPENTAGGRRTGSRMAAFRSW